MQCTGMVKWHYTDFGRMDVLPALTDILNLQISLTVQVRVFINLGQASVVVQFVGAVIKSRILPPECRISSMSAFTVSKNAGC